MPVKATLTTSNFPRPSKVEIKVNGQTHVATDYATTQRIMWLMSNDLQSLGAAIQQPSVQPHTRVITTTYMQPGDSIIYADAVNAPFTVYLPPADQVSGQILVVKRMNSGGNDVTVATVASPGATAKSTIDGAATKSLASQYAVLRVHCDGTNFWTV